MFRLRQTRGWSLREAASRAGIHHSRLDEIEKGTDKRSGKPLTPSYVNVVKLAKAYDLPPDELLKSAGYEPGIELKPDEWSLIREYRRLPETRRKQLLEALKEDQGDYQA